MSLEIRSGLDKYFCKSLESVKELLRIRSVERYNIRYTMSSLIEKKKL